MNTRRIEILYFPKRFVKKRVYLVKPPFVIFTTKQTITLYFCHLTISPPPEKDHQNIKLGCVYF